MDVAVITACTVSPQENPTQARDDDDNKMTGGYFIPLGN